ncbi:MAG: four helix bundle protein [Acidobacteria bacterium]|nr:four helix bundle protein [Acidobacteriota bacterium]
MAKFTRFEDVGAWQKARTVTKSIYLLTMKGLFTRDFGLVDQIRRASVSIMANIAEGFGRRSDKEFANFLNIAHGSAAEVQSHLYVAIDLGYINQEEFNQTYALLSETSKMTMNLATYLRQ